MKNILAMHLVNLERSNAELRAQTERFRLANDRLEKFLINMKYGRIARELAFR